MISIRLKSLGDMVNNCNRVIDVGCDHAILDIYLANKYKNIDLIATDISEKCIEVAKKNVKENNFENRIEVKVNDGLNNIPLKKDDFIIISGMGTSTIIDIITPYLTEINDILIQSNRDLERLRKFMSENDFYIEDEKVIFDEHYYVFIKFKKGKKEYNDEDNWLGPIVKTLDCKDYFEFLSKKYNKIYKGIPESDRKKIKINERIILLNNLIEKR